MVPGISNLVWALGAVSLPDREVFSRVGNLVAAGQARRRQVEQIDVAQILLLSLRVKLIGLQPTQLLCVEVDVVRGDYTARQMTNISWACLDKNADDLMFACISLHSLVLISFVLGEAGGCWSILYIQSFQRT